MSEEFDSPVSNVTEFSVSELSGAIKRTVEDAYGRVRVRGELGRVTRPASGHIYLDLKDDRSVIAAIIWKGAATKMAIQPEEGLEVIATGKVTTFPGQSKYQLIIDNIEPAGEGALMALLAERKRRLEAEGLFDPARKQLLPYMPRVIGVVTSPTGAVIRDILHRLSDRFPCHVLVWPVRVQGETSAGEVAAAIHGFNAIDALAGIPRPDLLIVARGGGALEDLWGFNDEVVVRAVASSDIPVISAVGHETDTTLIDYAADVRAPTPTAAAEIAVPVHGDLVAHVAQLSARLRGGLARSSDRKRAALRGLSRAMPRPDGLLALPRQSLDGLQMRLARALDSVATTRRTRLATLSVQLNPMRLVQQSKRLENDLNRLSRSLPASLERNLLAHRRELSFRTARLSPETIMRTSKRGRERLLNVVKRSEMAQYRVLSVKQSAFTQAAKLLGSLSHERVLDRGFALVHASDGSLIRNSGQVAKGAEVSIRFAGSDQLAAIVSSAGANKLQKSNPPKPKPTPNKGEQASLFGES